jgi:hypothetical protein
MWFLLAIFKAVWNIIVEIPVSFLEVFQLLWRILLQLIEKLRHPDREDPQRCCLPIPAGVWIAPDAYLYSQSYLMSLGMAVIWDNPDVILTDSGGAVVGSHDLKPLTKYRVTATIHNRSAQGPAPGMPVVFTLLTFGAGGTTRQSIGTDTINLPVRAAPGEPALASVAWTTPSVPGHYCIQIEAVWPTDANPLDNIGQHNTVVRAVNKGELIVLPVPVMHFLQGRTQLKARLDSYVLPQHPLRRRVREASSSRSIKAGETDAAFLKRLVAANSPDLFPRPADWNAALSHTQLPLEEGAEAMVELKATVPAAAVSGSEQRFNVTVSEEYTGKAVGGVTVILQVI